MLDDNAFLILFALKFVGQDKTRVISQNMLLLLFRDIK
jgi:hypothetical protein